jgi:hypothetical protein
MFDPTDLTVKDARSQLGELDMDDLIAVMQLEVDGKHRSSLLADIGRAIDALKTAAEEDDGETVEALAPTPPEYETITLEQYFGLKRLQKRMWERAADGSFRRLR